MYSALSDSNMRTLAGFGNVMTPNACTNP